MTVKLVGNPELKVTPFTGKGRFYYGANINEGNEYIWQVLNIDLGLPTPGATLRNVSPADTLNNGGGVGWSAPMFRYLTILGLNINETVVFSVILKFNTEYPYVLYP